MAFGLAVVPAVLGLLVLYKFLTSFIAERQNAAKAESLGCKPLPAYPQPWWDYLGLLLMRKWLNAATMFEFLPTIKSMYPVTSEKYGFDADTVTYRLAGSTNIFTKDPENIKALLATQFEDFEIGAARIGNFAPLLGYGIFSSNGTLWSHQRALLRPCFARDQINETHTTKRHVDAMLARMPAGENGWTNVVDISPMLFTFSLDHSTEFLFGESTDYQTKEAQGTVSREEGFQHDFDYAQDILADRFRMGDLYWMHSPKKFKEACKACHKFFDHYVEKALSSSAGQVGKDAEKGGKYALLDELVKYTRDPVEIRDNLFAVLLAGRDTTSSLLGYVFALLARDPKVYAKLREAVIADFGESGKRNHEIDFAALKNCSYLQYVMNETLRLHNPVPLNGPRIARKDTTLPRGGGPSGTDKVFVPKGTDIGYIISATHMDPKWWGADAAEFKPDRWQGRKHGWEFLPFHGGPRICIGQQFALTTAGYTLVRFVQRFDRLENADGYEEIKDNAKVTAQIAYGAKIRARVAGAGA